jgi:hypothetical protein
MESVMHALASRARFEDAPRPRRTAAPLELFIADLTDMTCAALTAPMSHETQQLLTTSTTAKNLARVKRST